MRFKSFLREEGQKQFSCGSFSHREASIMVFGAVIGGVPNLHVVDAEQVRELVHDDGQLIREKVLHRERFRTMSL